MERLAVGDGAVPFVRTLTVELSEPDGVEVVYGPEGGAGELVLRHPLANARHVLPLARLRADALHTVEVRPLSAPPGSEPAVTTFATPTLPEDLARLDFVTEGDATFPLTVFEITRSADGFVGVVIVDEDGHVVWWREGPLAGSTRRANGNFVFIRRDVLVEVAPTGEVVRELRNQGPIPHHDVIETGRNTLYFISLDRRTVEGEEVTGEAVWEWDPDAGALEKRWSAFDHLSWTGHRGPASRPSDWLHANSLALGPEGNVLMSFAFLDQVISIAPDFSRIEWILGGPNATIPTSPEAPETYFHYQHTASELPSDAGRRILLFDNGTHDRGYSRALELIVDPEAGTVDRAWEFVPPNLNHSTIVSLARRLENGNTFVHFGAGPGAFSSEGPVETYEVRPDGSVQWHAEVTGEDVDDGFVLYRAWPLETLVGESSRTVITAQYISRW